MYYLGNKDNLVLGEMLKNSNINAATVSHSCGRSQSKLPLPKGKISVLAVSHIRVEVGCKLTSLLFVTSVLSYSFHEATSIKLAPGYLLPMYKTKLSDT